MLVTSDCSFPRFTQLRTSNQGRPRRVSPLALLHLPSILAAARPAPLPLLEVSLTAVGYTLLLSGTLHLTTRGAAAVSNSVELTSLASSRHRSRSSVEAKLQLISTPNKMLIKVKRVQLTSDDPRLVARGDHAALTLANHALLSPHYYALLQPESPVAGVQAETGGIAVILYCAETGRSAITCLPPSFGGQGAVLGAQCDYLRKARATVDIECVVLRIEEDQQSARIVRDSIHLFAQAYGLGLTSRIKNVDKYFAFSVMKTSGTITLYNEPEEIYDVRALPEDHYFELCSLLTGVQDLVHEQGAASGMLIKCQCQYDGTQLVRRLPQLTPSAQDLLKANEHVAILNSDESLDALMSSMRDAAASDEGLLGWVQSAAAAHLKEKGPFCSVCAEVERLRRCTGCMWVYYCSLEHQREDWPHHKEW